MNLIESLKSSAIRLTDTINKLNDPWDPFDRPTYPPHPKRLLVDMEREFYGDFVNQFWGCDGRVLLHRIPLDTRLGLDTGDQAIWHGIFTAMLALRYHVLNKSEAHSEEQGQSQNSFGHLVEAAKGLQLHQTVHGEARPRLIRGVKDDGKTFEDNASNDSATGHLLGIYFGWKFGPPTMQPVFAQLATGLAAELHNNGNALVRADGTPTTYGALEQGWKTDPLRITLALAIYAVGATLTREPIFINDYEHLFRKYKALIPYPKVKLWWIENYNDTHRAAIHLAILADLTAGQAHDLCAKGLSRIQKMVEKEGNVWVDGLYEYGTRARRGDLGVMARKVLTEFTLPAKQHNPGVSNWPRLPIFGFDAETWMPRAVQWNKKWMSSQPIPRYAARTQDFFWQRNLRSLDADAFGVPADSKMNCGDWLCAYWLARMNGTLSEKD